VRKKIIIGIVSLVAIAGATALLAPRFFSVEALKQRIVQEVENNTNRRVAIDGEVKLTLWPAASIVLGDVRFANAPWAKHKEMITIKKLSLELAWVPLLSGDVQITRLVLNDPVIHLEISKNGTPNWEFNEKRTPQLAAATTTTTDVPLAVHDEGDATSVLQSLTGVTLGDMRIVGGSLHLLNHATSETYALSQMQANLVLKNLHTPATLSLSGHYQDKPVNLKIKTGALQNLIDKGQTELSLDVAAESRLEADFTGSLLSKPEGYDVQGVLNAASKDMHALFAWLGIDAKLPVDAYKQASLRGQLHANATQGTLDQAMVVLDSLSSTGKIAWNLSKKIPSISTTLVFEQLNLAPYLGVAETSSHGGLGIIQPVHAASERWSNTPIDFDWIKSLTLDANIKAARLLLGKPLLEQVTLELAIKNGVLVANIPSAILYGGQGQAHFEVNSAGATPVVNASLDVSHVNLGKALEDLGMDTLSGTGETQWTVVTTGKSMAAWVDGLQGKGSLNIKEGALRGINVLEMIQKTAAAFHPSEGQRTPFKSLAATAQIKNGVLHNQDLLLEGDNFRSTGQGSASLPAWQVNYRLTPTLYSQPSSIEGKAPKGLSVPIIIEGALDKPSFRPDLASAVQDILKNPEAFKENLQQLRKDAKGGLKGLLGTKP
jgi:AsmA protein